MTPISIERLFRARRWCLNNQHDSALRRLTCGRFGRFDGQVDRSWWLRALSGRPKVEYTHPQQRPAHYLPFLEAHPIWEDRCPKAEFLEQHWALINGEFESLAERVSHHPAVPGRVEGNGWLSLQLYYGQACSAALRWFPKTVEILNQLPHCGEALGAVFFSVLKPHTVIQAHYGPTNARLRYHLGLRIPSGCWLEVAGHRTSWQAGKCLKLDDSFRHSVGNDTDNLRAILVVDLWHPGLTKPEREALARGWTSWGPLSRRPKRGPV